MPDRWAIGAVEKRQHGYLTGTSTLLQPTWLTRSLLFANVVKWWKEKEKEVDCLLKCRQRDHFESKSLPSTTNWSHRRYTAREDSGDTLSLPLRECEHAMSRRVSAGPSTSSRRVSRVVGDSDDDSQQPRNAQAGSSSSRRRLVKGEQGVEEESDEDDTFGELAQPLEMPQIDDEFRNVSLKRDDAGLKLNNLLKEWKDVERKVHGHMELLGASAGELQESLIDVEDDNEEAEEVVSAHLCLL